jgi:hypothetical protein
MPQKELTITVLPDGTIKTQTGDMSGVAHHSVDQFMKGVARGLGSEPEIEKLKPNHTHTHHHTHSHEHVKQ